jgi:methionyl-tRNA synthetase
MKGRVMELILEDEQAKGLNKFITDSFDKFDINLVCQMIWNSISKLDKRLSDEEVFKVIKTDESAGIKILTDYVSKLATIAYELGPVLPETSAKIIALIKENKKRPPPFFVFRCTNSN